MLLGAEKQLAQSLESTRLYVETQIWMSIACYSTLDRTTIKAEALTYAWTCLSCPYLPCFIFIFFLCLQLLRFYLSTTVNYLNNSVCVMHPCGVFVALLKVFVSDIKSHLFSFTMLVYMGTERTQVHGPACNVQPQLKSKYFNSPQDGATSQI